MEDPGADGRIAVRCILRNMDIYGHELDRSGSG